MKRRLLFFFASLFASQFVVAQQRIPLSGLWQRRIAGMLYDSVPVPSSYRPIGSARLTRSVNFPALNSHQRLFIRFEGVGGAGNLVVNGREAGALGPYARYEFDVTSFVKAGENKIEVELTDWQVPSGLGPTAAWEAYGGIIYDAYAEVRSDPYIENARLSYQLSPDFKSVDCQLDVFLRSTVMAQSTIHAELKLGETRVGQAEQSVNASAGESVVSLKFKLDDVHLWSPSVPTLYSVSTNLSNSGNTNTFSFDTGFRSLTIRGNQFLLNGSPFVFKGVARHHMWEGQGFTLTSDQIDQDMRMIKSMGANSVRLVHYPHDPRVLAAAARTGLFVSEESGISWIDFRKAPSSLLDTGIGNLEREVKRDWNNPALFAILVANESTPSVDLMRSARDRVQKLAPGLFVSMPGAISPDDKPETLKQMFDDAGFDFYTAHPYTFDPQDFVKVAAVYSTKPLIFSEWAGPVGRLPLMMDREVQALGKLVQEGKLAGHWFWEWADMAEFGREDLSMENGILVEGVVTQDRKVKHEVFSRLAELYRYSPGEAVPAPSRDPEFLPTGKLDADPDSIFSPIAIQSIVANQSADSQSGDWRQFEKSMSDYWISNQMSEHYWQDSGETFWTWDAALAQVGPIPFTTAQIESHTRPAVVLNGKSVEIPLDNLSCDRLHFLGNSTLPDGYPTRGEVGGPAGKYVVIYKDGEQQLIPLRWGLELARSNVLAVATRTNPVAVLAPQVIRFTRNPVHEEYRTLLYSVAVKHKPIARLRIEMDPLPETRPLVSRPNVTGSGYAAGDTALLLFAVTGEQKATKK
ncbi:MAG TPA: glycoside hydrolase family 2 TIM barrel-domain containing protein [Terriglobales bacterium]|nr:glycoside hydrolase family 2 TIM barrel-domain containing protein [Terriglobales bacterium]